MTSGQDDWKKSISKGEILQGDLILGKIWQGGVQETRGWAWKWVWTMLYEKNRQVMMKGTNGTKGMSWNQGFFRGFQGWNGPDKDNYVKQICRFRVGQMPIVLLKKSERPAKMAGKHWQRKHKWKLTQDRSRSTSYYEVRKAKRERKVTIQNISVQVFLYPVSP